MKNKPRDTSKKKISWNRFNKFCSQWPIQVVTNSQLADVFRMSLRTLERMVKSKYGVALSRHRIKKSMGIRQGLFERLYVASAKGNLGATIWLTKNLMQWSEPHSVKSEIKATQKIDQNVTYDVEFGNGIRDEAGNLPVTSEAPEADEKPNG